MEDKQVQLLEKICSNCHEKLLVEKDHFGLVECPFCERSVDVIDPGSGFNYSADKKTYKQDDLSLITSVSAGENYLSLITNNYDWNEFVSISDLVSIPEMDIVINNLKLSNGNEAKVWKLDVIARLTAIKKKIEYQNLLIDKLLELHGDNFEEFNQLFITFKMSNNYLQRHKDEIVETLASVIEEYNKRAPKIATSSLDKYLEEAKDLLKQIKYVEQVDDIASFKKGREKINKEVEKKLKLLELDAEEVYNKARQDEEEKNYVDALRNYNLLGGYKDSESHRDKCNHFYADQHYLEILHYSFYLNTTSLNTLDDLRKQTTDQGSTVRNKKNKVIIDRIKVIIGHFASRLFYFDLDYNLYCYDFSLSTKTLIEGGPSIDFGKDFDKYWMDGNRQKFYFLKHLSNEFIKDKSVKVKIKNNNEYSLVMLDLSLDTFSLTPVIKELSNIYYFTNNVIFYETFGYEIEKDQSSKKTKTHFVEHASYLIHDFTSEETTTFHDPSVKISKIHQNNVIYLRPNRSLDNMSLCIKKIFGDENEEIVIDPNIYNFEFVYDNEIYYSVGHQFKKALHRYNLANGQISEVLTSFNNEKYNLIGDYLYYFIGDQYNLTLKKLGLKTRSIKVVASRINKSFKITSGYFYYSDRYKRLYSVRTDGGNKTIISENVVDFVGVYNNRVYFICEEFKDDDKHNRTSMYSSSPSGSEIRKVAFDTYLVRPKASDIVNLLVIYRENKTFRCITKGEDQSPFNRYVYKYNNLNLANGILEHKFTTNIPSKVIMKEHKFLFFKPRYKELKLEYEELPHVEIPKDTSE